MHFLAPRPGETAVDGTVGYGGHAERILEKLGPDGRLIGFDKDPSAVRAAGERLRAHGDKVMIMNDDFKNMVNRLRDAGVGRVDSLLLDLGVSSPQVDEPARGFSFSQEGPLDMRMNPGTGPTAADLVNRLPEHEIERIIREYGEERYARRIAGRIAMARASAPLKTTAELAELVRSAVPAPYRYGRIHPATRTFQALRIAVNHELESLSTFLESALDILAPGGRLTIISFHSLEDRIVKRAFRSFQDGGKGEILTKKPVTASDVETASNPRSRSAKLRAFRKAAEDAR